jgi:hypothetical protein
LLTTDYYHNNLQFLPDWPNRTLWTLQILLSFRMVHGGNGGDDDDGNNSISSCGLPPPPPPLTATVSQSGRAVRPPAHLIEIMEAQIEEIRMDYIAFEVL